MNIYNQIIQVVNAHFLNDTIRISFVSLFFLCRKICSLFFHLGVIEEVGGISVSA
ncbi:MAG: hypothetical protein ACLVDM_09815 [Alistipes shahii]|uniref:hypothetical protein n=1 Tax=Alistipes TaxID=239759 RepID=UPI001EFFC9E4|nr:MULTISPECIES: hypothetical protein [Alistipes]